MELTIDLKGDTPLCCHNIRLADPQDEFAQAIARITSKTAKQKTEQDSFEVERLEWLGGLYYDAAVGYYLEGNGIVRCFQEAAKATREGRDVQRALKPLDFLVPIDFPHRHLKPDKLWEFEDPGRAPAWWFRGRHPYRFRRAVGIGKSRVMRMRPLFPEWSVSFRVDFEPTMLDFAALQEIVHRAGRVEGLYEARSLGMGRFQATVTAPGEANGRATNRAARKAAAEA